MENRPDKPQPLFGDNDIRHSVETVNERWEREMSRRRRLAAKIVIPLAVILIASGLLITKKYQVFPFTRPAPKPFIPPSPEEEMKERVGKQPVEKLGYEKAEIRFSVAFARTLPEMPKEILDVLYAATDSKPSRIYAEIWKEEDAPKDLKEYMGGSQTVTFFINDAPLMEDLSTPEKLIKVINDYYSRRYRDDSLVIAPDSFGFDKPTEEQLQERTEKRIKDEQYNNLKLPSFNFETK